jgi:hypothetical protein
MWLSAPRNVANGESPPWRAPGGERPFACREQKRGRRCENGSKWFERFPKAAYMTEIESWRELADDEIEFVMRRLPTAD